MPQHLLPSPSFPRRRTSCGVTRTCTRARWRSRWRRGAPCRVSSNAGGEAGGRCSWPLNSPHVDMCLLYFAARPATCLRCASTEVMESGAVVTFTGTAAVLALGFGPGATTPFTARTLPPYTDIETVRVAGGALARPHEWCVRLEGLAWLSSSRLSTRSSPPASLRPPAGHRAAAQGGLAADPGRAAYGHLRHHGLSGLSGRRGVAAGPRAAIAAIVNPRLPAATD